MADSLRVRLLLWYAAILMLVIAHGRRGGVRRDLAIAAGAPSTPSSRARAVAVAHVRRARAPAAPSTSSSLSDATAYFQESPHAPVLRRLGRRRPAHRPDGPRRHRRRARPSLGSAHAAAPPRGGHLEPRASRCSSAAISATCGAKLWSLAGDDGDGRARRRGGVARRRLVSRRPRAGAGPAHQRDRAPDGRRRSQRAHRHRADRHRARSGGVGPQPRVRPPARVGRAPAPLHCRCLARAQDAGRRR